MLQECSSNHLSILATGFQPYFKYKALPSLSLQPTPRAGNAGQQGDFHQTHREVTVGKDGSWNPENRLYYSNPRETGDFGQCRSS